MTQELRRANISEITLDQLRAYIHADSLEYAPHVVPVRASEGEHWEVDDHALTVKYAEDTFICDYETSPGPNDPQSALSASSGTKLNIVKYDVVGDKIILSGPRWGGSVWEETDEYVGENAHRRARMPLAAVLAEAEVESGCWITIQDYFFDKSAAKIKFGYINNAVLQRGRQMLSSNLWK